ncbi:MAG: bifunctional riboflavin kinase/FAD synthetase [Verrucomicrobiota bacterium]
MGIHELGSLEEPLFLALGVFDGVHIGHQAVIEPVVEAAREQGGLAGVVTFEPHPVRVLAPERAPKRILASLEHKERLMGEMGVDVVVVVEFSREFANRSGDDFLGMLSEAGDLRMLSMGADWRFGRGREGDVGLLRAFGEREGVEIVAREAVMRDGERVSSTRVRQALRDGNLGAVEGMLGRRYSVMGEVVRGRQLGQQLGFPTANIVAENELLPPEGVWVVEANWEGEWKRAVANLGRRPTVDESGERSLEVHVLDWEGDLYGKVVEVRFVVFLRGEQKFGSVEELKEQIARDIRAARE